jgi:hypothetical protein
VRPNLEFQEEVEFVDHAGQFFAYGGAMRGEFVAKSRWGRGAYHQVGD